MEYANVTAQRYAEVDTVDTASASSNTVKAADFHVPLGKRRNLRT